MLVDRLFRALNVDPVSSPALVPRILRRFSSLTGLDLPPNEWVENGRAKFLDQVLPKGGVGAEVGVYKGQFTPLLLEIVEPKKLHIIDPWYLLGAEWRWGSGNRSTVLALTRLMRRLEPYLVDGRVVLHIGDDLEVLPKFEPEFFDWLYIDSSHEYNHTRKELDIAQRIIRNGGLICGDDWRDDPNHRHYGVRKAVEEFCSVTEFNIIYASAKDRQWAIRRNGTPPKTAPGSWGS
jgi:hypothetical protein